MDFYHCEVDHKLLLNDKIVKHGVKLAKTLRCRKARWLKDDFLV